MPVFCSVIGCSNRGKRDIVRFFRIPVILKHRVDSRVNFYQLSRERREKWITALQRGNPGECFWKNARVCSKHFIRGAPSKLQDTDNPDWAPSQHLGYTIVDGTVCITKRTCKSGRKTLNERPRNQLKEVENVSSHVKPKLMEVNSKLVKVILPHKFECPRKIIVKQKINTNTKMKNIICKNVIEKDNEKNSLEEGAPSKLQNTDNPDWAPSQHLGHTIVDGSVYKTEQIIKFGCEKINERLRKKSKEVENVSSHVKPKFMEVNLKLRNDILEINTKMKNIICNNTIEQDNVKSCLEEGRDVHVVPVSIGGIEGITVKKIYNTEDSQQDDDLDMERDEMNTSPLDVKVKEEVGELNNDIKAEIKIEPQDADDINDLLMNAIVKQEPAEEENNDTASTILYDHIDAYETEIKIEYEKDSLQSEAETSISSQLTNHSSKDSYENQEICDSESEKVNKRTYFQANNYVCYICKKKISSWFDLRHHKKCETPVAVQVLDQNVQFDLNPFKCNICEKSFKLLSHLKLHQKYHAFYECYICMKKFISLNMLENHQKNHSHTSYVNFWSNYQSTSPSDSVHIQNHLINRRTPC